VTISEPPPATAKSRLYLAFRYGLRDDEPMRHESCVTSLSWIPSEAITGTVPRAAFEVGLAHYDDPPPAELGDIEQLRAADRFRFANVLRAWVDVDNSGRITGSGYSEGSRGLIGSTIVRLGGLHYNFQAVQLPDLRRDPERGEGSVRFVQTAGGRTGLPAPRRVRRRPYVQWQAPTAWTTLSLTLHADGHVDFGLAGASRFPRHWLYDRDGQLSRKSGLIDFDHWYTKSFGRYSPWGDEDSPALITQVETSLEHALSEQLMRGGAKGSEGSRGPRGARGARGSKPAVSNIPAGAILARQGEPGTDVYLVLDGVVRVERDGEPLAEYGPGALLGERAYLEEGTRTSTLVAVTPSRVAAVDAGELERSALEELAEGHRREDAR
jgi:Cyclic nucleotide-binding domain